MFLGAILIISISLQLESPETDYLDNELIELAYLIQISNIAINGLVLSTITSRVIQTLNVE